MKTLVNSACVCVHECVCVERVLITPGALTNFLRSDLCYSCTLRADGERSSGEKGSRGEGKAEILRIIIALGCSRASGTVSDTLLQERSEFAGKKQRKAGAANKGSQEKQQLC